MYRMYLVPWYSFWSQYFPKWIHYFLELILFGENCWFVASSNKQYREIMLMLWSVFTRIIILNSVSQSGNWKWHSQCLECSSVSKHSQGIHLWILPFLLLTSMLACRLCNKQTRYSIYKRNNEFGHILGTHCLGRTCQTQRLWAEISGSAWLGVGTQEEQN